MASIKGAIDLTGKPGGANKNKIKNDEKFLRTRENNLERKGVLYYHEPGESFILAKITSA